MLLSMTGHGEARIESGGCIATAQVRAVNGRYLKITLRGYDFTPSDEAAVEALARQTVKRGNVTVNVRIEGILGPSRFKIQKEVLRQYLEQLSELAAEIGAGAQVELGTLLPLPGVVEPVVESEARRAAEMQTIRLAVSEAFEQLTSMRVEEGRAMAADLEAKRASILHALEVIETRAPEIVAGYRTKLKERISALLYESNVSVSESDFLKEVGLFADRCDISEEIVRLRSHLDQFARVLAAPDSEGRKLEFIIQEMFRETNTIGAKANDAEVAALVVEIKNDIERMREMVQNVE